MDIVACGFCIFFWFINLTSSIQKTCGNASKSDIILKVILESALLYMKSELFINPNLILSTVYQANFYAAAAAAAKSLQSCLTLCDPIDSSPTGSPIPGILQARTLEWVAISFSNA